MRGYIRACDAQIHSSFDVRTKAQIGDLSWNVLARLGSGS